MKLSISIFAICASALIYFNSCTKDKTPTSTITADCPDTVKFSTQVLPWVMSKCNSCHQSGGQNPVLGDHSSVSNHSTKILKSIKGEIKLMPDGGPALNDSLIKQFECWINQGKQNN